VQGRLPNGVALIGLALPPDGAVLRFDIASINRMQTVIVIGQLQGSDDKPLKGTQLRNCMP